VLAIPSLDRAIAYLESLEDPTIKMRLILLRDPEADVAETRKRVAAQPGVTEAFVAQRPDGSWGDHERAANRLLPTLWMVKTLGELGLDKNHRGWNRAVAFLVEQGHIDDGVFSIRSSRDGVLSCYVGLAALIYLRGGLSDLAHPQLDWIRRYQEIKAGGRDRRDGPVDEWGPHLRTKYGGCMAKTTCLVGLLRAGRALALSGNDWAQPLVAAIREAYVERRAMYASDERIVPLAVSSKKSDSWLKPTFPTDWRIDLIEVIGFLTETGPADPRMQDAFDKIAEFQLPDGTWPLRRSYRPAFLPGVERPSTHRPSPMITMRVVEALTMQVPAQQED